MVDLVTVVEALAQAREREPRLRLVVMGARHPEGRWEEQQAARDLRTRAEELGLLDAGAVVLSEGWVPYAERHRYLLDADAAVSAHRDTLETRLSFRTRFLDQLWTGLPTLTTGGGELTDRMVAAGAARAVDAGDVDGWTRLLLDFATAADQRAAMRRAALELAPAYGWRRVCEPLVAICVQLTATGRAAAFTPRGRRGALVRYMRLLVRVRVQAKGLGSLGAAVRGASGR